MRGAANLGRGRRIRLRFSVAQRGSEGGGYGATFQRQDRCRFWPSGQQCMSSYGSHALSTATSCPFSRHRLQEKKALSEDRAVDQAEAKSKVVAESREEDCALPVNHDRGRRKRPGFSAAMRKSEGGGFGKRLSDNGNMIRCARISNAPTGMSAMRSLPKGG